MKVELKNLQETFKILENIDKERANQAINNITQDVYENVRFYAKEHYKTGTMERNIRHNTKTQAGIVWIDDNNMLVNWKGKRINYANFVLFGTRPHLICPKNRKFLRIFAKLDKFRFENKCVHHPGYRGDDFLYRAVKDTFKRLDEIKEKVLNTL